MFGFLKPKSTKDKLESKHKQLLQKAFEISKINRAQADALYHEAEMVLVQIAKLETQGK
ncbi:MAG: Lacal_2735 family protein [Schleiferiaceae bacterium]|jgi:hypothetical protein|nr:Lacal_2735 family protein [Schleiferiaceae bacterium]